MIIFVLVLVVWAPVLVLSEHTLRIVSHGRDKSFLASSVEPSPSNLARAPFEDSGHKSGYPCYKGKPEEYGARPFGATPSLELSFEGITKARMGIIVWILATWLRER